VKRLLLIAALAVFGCDKSSSHKSPAPPASPPPTESVVENPPPATASSPEVAAPVADVAKGPAPAGSGASAPERQAAAYDLLAGGPALEELPLVAVEDGAEFDPNLRDRVAPAVGPIQVRTSKVSVRGSLDKNVVRRVVRQRVSALRVCYTQNTQGRAPQKDTLDVRFVIDKTGKVVSAVKRGGTVPESVTRCALSALRTRTFPKPESGGIVVVDYSFEFGPPGL
jgi:hypothetical protein